jgi:hypothetical protein
MSCGDNAQGPLANRKSHSAHEDVQHLHPPAGISLPTPASPRSLSRFELAFKQAHSRHLHKLAKGPRRTASSPRTAVLV